MSGRPGTRTRHLDTETVVRLRRHRTAQLKEQLAFEDGYGTDGYVFCDEAGQPLHPGVVTTMFGAIVKRAALPVRRLHDLRHTWATNALAAGVPLVVVARCLGQDPATTLATYSHALPGDYERAGAVTTNVVAR